MPSRVARMYLTRYAPASGERTVRVRKNSSRVRSSEAASRATRSESSEDSERLDLSAGLRGRDALYSFQGT